MKVVALLQDLIQQIDDPALRKRILQETDKLVKQKKFGLVFEEHLPECTPLYDMPIHVGSKVALKTGYVKEIYTVLKIDGDDILCDGRETHEHVSFKKTEIVVIAEFGEPIYPTLKPIDSVENAPDSELWHTLIEADNYHALQLLEYLYAGKVDCIYIDPPYNTGAKDWKYNNDYVDGSDAYRHSKWLSFMEKRLKIAKRLLNPATGVMIVTIDEHEVHHLRALLEQIMPEFYIQMTTYVTNPKGVTQGRFSRVEEYALYCFAPNAFVCEAKDNLLNPVEEGRKPRWKGLLRSGTNARREDRKNMFYPVYVDKQHKRVVGTGTTLPYEQLPDLDMKSGEYELAWPIRSDGSYGNWGVGYETLRKLIDKGYVSLGKYDTTRKTWAISYISIPNQKLIDDGNIIITSRDSNTGVVNIEYANSNNRAIKTVWYRTLHDAGAYGTDLVSSIIGRSRTFSFPKSVYAEKDAISAVLKNNKNALIIDFFAGSGTTLHAVNIMNYEDGGNRRCILITNNEVSNDEATELKKQGFQAGDREWEELGIAHSVTWPRTKNSILGKRKDGSELQNEYITSLSEKKFKQRKFIHVGYFNNIKTMNKKDKKALMSLFAKGILPQNLISDETKFVVSDNEKHNISVLFDDDYVDEWLDALDEMFHITTFYIFTKNKSNFDSIKNKIDILLGDIEEQVPLKISMKNGFKTNAQFLKLSFLDKTSIALGRQFRELMPVLWMKGGAVGKCPLLKSNRLPKMLIIPQNKMAVLIDETCYSEFDAELSTHTEIQTIFIVTDSESAYREMIRTYDNKDCYQLYRDYLDNFRINTRR